ncbi:Alpha/Beta hydrolase protein [Rhodotorula diobovata]|uniref:Alpha/Beta hydrolase protein n=1 Tax=Rhodotorula diobovata TaxID=5288 RepID=A0A5C5G338_9BASI|nr:Alpha/Beta hydrolase protein [Rhodotorula diobovata]
MAPLHLPSLRSLIAWIAGTLAVSLTAGGTALYLAQCRLIYPSNMPAGSRTNVPRPDEFGLAPFDDVELVAPDGVKIRAFVIPYARGDVKPSDRPTVLLLHANAGNVGHRLPIAKVFWERMRCNVVALSYRGYGHSEGSPSEQGIKLDAQTALDYILSHPELEKTQIFLYGQSIGGAVAIFLASQNAQRVKGLIIENTFLSLPKLVPHVLPFLRPFVPFLLHQIWPSERYIATLPGDFPVLFLAGSRDELVEPGQMKGLWERCGSKVKRWIEFPYGTHNDTCVQPQYFAHISSFIAEHSSLPLGPSHPAAPTSSAPTPAPAPAPASPHVTTADSEPEPAATEPSSPTVSTTSSSGSSFELVDRSVGSLGGELEKRDDAEEKENDGETEGEKLELREGISAGSFGPREELEEAMREGEELVKEKL